MVPTTEVTVSVDMQLQTVADDGVFIAGSFNEWPDPGMPMTDNGDGTWSATVELEQGATVEYKFQNGAGGWENIVGTDCTLGDFGNRFVEVGTEPSTVETICFNYCVDCATVVDVVDPAFAAGITVFPNPASNQTTVNYNFETSVDLTISVTNTLGQVMSTALVSNVTTGTHTLDVSDLAAGMYMIQITDGARMATQSLVVE